MIELSYASQHPIRQSREFVVRALYEWMMCPDALDRLVEGSACTPKPNMARAALLGAVSLHQEAIQAMTPLLVDQQWERLYRIEQAILFQAYYELALVPCVPYRVVINEAVDLAKVYGGDESFRLINHILDRLAPQLRPLEIRTRASSAKVSDAG